MRLILTGAATAILASAMLSPADAECTCRARNGIEAFLGETICIPTSNGPQLARCEMVLNNPSWTFLNAPCPQALFDQTRDRQTAQSTAILNRPIVR